MDKLTNIYMNTDSIKNTNQKVYYSGGIKSKNIINEINEIFKYTNIVYDKRVKINTKEEIITATIIAKDINSLITNMYEIIPIENIIDIKLIENN